MEIDSENKQFYDKYQTINTDGEKKMLILPNGHGQCLNNLY